MKCSKTYFGCWDNISTSEDWKEAGQNQNRHTDEVLEAILPSKKKPMEFATRLLVKQPVTRTQEYHWEKQIELEKDFDFPGLNTEIFVSKITISNTQTTGQPDEKRRTRHTKSIPTETTKNYRNKKKQNSKRTKLNKKEDNNDALIETITNTG